MIKVICNFRAPPAIKDRILDMGSGSFSRGMEKILRAHFGEEYDSAEKGCERANAKINARMSSTDVPWIRKA